MRKNDGCAADAIDVGRSPAERSPFMRFLSRCSRFTTAESADNPAVATEEAALPGLGSEKHHILAGTRVNVFVTSTMSLAITPSRRSRFKWNALLPTMPESGDPSSSLKLELLVIFLDDGVLFGGLPAPTSDMEAINCDGGKLTLLGGTMKSDKEKELSKSSSLENPSNLSAESLAR